MKEREDTPAREDKNDLGRALERIMTLTMRTKMIAAPIKAAN